MTKDDQQQYDNWSKKQIYVAYLGENAARKQSEDALNKAVRNNSMIKYDRDMFKMKYLREHIPRHQSINGDTQQAIDEYFSDPTARVYFTPSGGYYCTQDKEDHLWLTFVWANSDKAKAEYKDMPELLKSIAGTEMRPIRWTGTTNVLRNHSKSLGSGVYELML